SVVFTIAGGEVLKATGVSDLSAAGAPVSTAAGVYLYVAMAGVFFTLAVVPAIMLVRSQSVRQVPP
ncbi:MAG: MFS transporter, partial [Mycolicibacterium sp.]